MGREVRRVPPNWQHPIDKNGYIPLIGRNFLEAAREWIAEFKDHESKSTEVAAEYAYYWDYEMPPESEHYVHYTQEEATWFQVYETVSEGTPITPPFETEEELIAHLIENGDEWDGPVSPQAARKFVLETKWCPSITMTHGVVYKGINGVLA